MPPAATTLVNEDPTSDKTSVDSTVEHASVPTPVGLEYHEVKTHKDVVNKLASKVNKDEQFFIVARRTAPFSRILKLWQRQSSKSCATNILRVHYSGEDGIDSGAMALEFLEKTIQEIGSKMFTGGTPIESSSHVQSGDFRTCGEIIAVSLAQGGSPPCFLDQCSYDGTFKDIDMTNITSEQLSSKELQLLSKVRSDCTKHVDLILEKGYTGPIDVEHIEAIIGSLKVGIVSKHALHMKEFVIGLNSYGMADMIKSKLDECRPLFVNGALKNEVVPDADYLYSLMMPQYSRGIFKEGR